MNDDLTLGINTTGIIVLSVIAIIAASLMFHRKLSAYLKHHYFLDSLLNTFLWFSLWLIGKEFMKWWLSAIIAVSVTLLIERLAKKQNSQKH